MKCPQWSASAHNVIHKFYDADITVFVEGKDDINFWQHKFEQLVSGIKVHIEAVHGDDSISGGCKLLAEKMRIIIEENGRFLVAADKDYNVVIDSMPNNPLILKTYGYSIENSLLCPKIVNRALCKKLHDFSIDETVELSTAISSICESLKCILVYDIANELFHKGKKVLSENPFQYIVNNGKGIRLKAERIDAKIKEIAPSFSDQEMYLVTTKLEASPLDIRYVVRGHFLLRVIYNVFFSLLKKHGYTHSLSMYDFYDAIVDECQITCDCPDLFFLKEEINIALDYLHTHFK